MPVVTFSCDQDREEKGGGGIDLIKQFICMLCWTFTKEKQNQQWCILYREKQSELMKTIKKVKIFYCNTWTLKKLLVVNVPNTWAADFWSSKLSISNCIKRLPTLLQQRVYGFCLFIICLIHFIWGLFSSFLKVGFELYVNTVCYCIFNHEHSTIS